MQEQDQQFKPYTSGVFLHVIFKYRKHLIILGIVSIILASIFSSPYFITPLYKSTVILYPTASKSISKALLSENRGNTKDILEFGEEEQTEQMLQVLNSNMIRDRVIVKYNLLDHYNIPRDAKYKMTRLFREYEDNFNFRRTEYMAVKITVYDRDAQLAADMANDIAELVDSTINRMQKEVAVEAFKIVETEYLKLKDEINHKEDSLTVLRGFGVHDYESQSEMFNRQLAIEMAKGNTGGVNRLENRLDTLAKYGGPYVSLRDALEHDKKQLSELKAKYEEAKVDATQDLPHKFVVSSAYKAEKKSYPIRWLIVIVTTISVCFMAVVVFGAMEAYSGRIDLNSKKKRTWLNNIFNPLKSQGKIADQDDDKEDKKAKNKVKEVQPPDPVAKPIVNENKNRTTGTVESKTQNAPKTINANPEDHKNIEMDNYFNSANLISLIVKWKYHLLIIVVIAALLSAIFSGPAFITPLYKSYAVVYPANVDSYSEESETEQMLQIMNAQDIIDSMIDKFNLSKHYEIDPNYKYYKTVLLLEYHQNVSISKTPFESVKIEVMDKNPDTAAAMVTAILGFYDKKVAHLHKSKYVEVINMYAKQLAYKRSTLDSLKNIMVELGTEYGIFDYSTQSQEIMRGYLKTITGPNVERVNTKEVARLLSGMQLKGGQLIEVVRMIEDEARTYSEVKLDYEMALRFYNADMTYSNIVTYPYPADKKSYPIRWLIVVVATLAAFVFAMLVLLFIEKRAARKN